MLNGRVHRSKTARRIIAGASLSALVFTVSVQSISHAEPSIDEVEERVSSLYHEAEVAQERLNDIKSELDGKRDRLAALKRDLKHQRSEVRRIGDVVAATVADQAQTTTFGPTGELLFADDPEQFLDGLAAAEAFNSHQGQMLTQLATESDKLDLRQEQVDAEVEELSSDRKKMAKESSTVEAKLAEAKDLLAELKAEERERLRLEHANDQASRSESRAPISNVPASGRAGVAVNYALAQVGDAYVYGAAGPDAYDCSGLTMAAWGQAGVSLPHSSSGQMSYGTPVSSSALQPGDLVFYYSPVSHVGIYIGSGQIVHAANPSTGVATADVFSMPYSGAVRPG